MGSDAAQEKARQGLMIATAVGIRCPDSFVVGPNSPPNDGECIVEGMLRQIPKANDKVGVMCPTLLRQAERLEVANEVFDVLGGGKHPGLAPKSPLDRSQRTALFVPRTL